MQHGFSDISDSWDEFGYVAALRERYRIVLPDLRGHGESDKPHDRAAYTAAHYAGDLAAVLDDAGISRTVYWGYSHGGWTGFAAARHIPECLKALIIGGASASNASAFPRQPGEEDPLIAMLKRPLSEALSLFGGALTLRGERRFLGNDATALIACRQERLATEGYSDVVGQIAVPTLIYAGSNDPIHDPARQSAAEIRGATFVSLPGLNHIDGIARMDLVLPHVRPFLDACR